MSEGRWALEILGARLLGPPPLRDVWVPLEAGLHAFYGLNGAGKTRLLWALADIYSGIGDGYLVGRLVHQDDQDSFQRRTRDFGTVLAHHLQRDRQAPEDWISSGSSAPWFAPDRPDVHRIVGEQMWAAAHLMTSEPSGARRPLDDLLQEIDEVVRQGLFALVPQGPGRSGNPTWLVTPAAIIDGTTPLLEEGANGLRAATQAFVRAASDAGFSEPFSEHSDVIEHLEPLFNEATHAAGFVREGRVRLENVVTFHSPLFEIIRDAYLEDLEVEVALLADAGLAPYRLGLGDAFHGLATIEGVVADVVRSDQLNASRAEEATRVSVGTALDQKSKIEATAEGSMKPSDLLLGEAEHLESTINYIYRALLTDAPDLHLKIRNPDSWFLHDATMWVAQDLGGREVVLEDLSEAQRRWSFVAIALGLFLARTASSGNEHNGGWVVERPLVVALDEPDAALHATAQRHAVAGLASMAADFAASVYCSTHSREFLNADRVALHHVKRDLDGTVALESLSSVDREQLHDLGLEPADLFLQHRVILVVEGAHDEYVIDKLVGRELADARVLVLAMRGGRNLATVVDAHLISQFSDAPVIAALDNLNATKINSYWQELVENGQRASESFDEITRRHFTSKLRDEEIFLINYCRAAVSQGELHRFKVFAFGEPDIPQYLPVAAIVPGATSWDALREAFAAQSKHKSFKPWLAERFGVNISLDLLGVAIEQLDTVPGDFVDLLELCRTIGRRTLSSRI